MPTTCADIFRKHARALLPIPAQCEPTVGSLDGVRAVLLDLYGTLLISGSGEVGTAKEAACESALGDALAALGIQPGPWVGSALECFFAAIESAHAEGRASGIEYPEVDVPEIWRGVLAECSRRGLIDANLWDRTRLERLSVEYEARANPVGPMPGAETFLRRLRERGFVMGIVSNAQFYTVEQFAVHLGGPPESWGFEPDLQFYSYRHGRAKPGADLYRMAADALARRAIEPSQVVYVGNDMLNDVLPAAQTGFRTALFAGDARSLRLRRGDPRVDGLAPDLIVTSLTDLGDRLRA